MSNETMTRISEATDSQITNDNEDEQLIDDKGPLEKVVPETGDMCKGREDGTYPHPDNCHSYVYCSNELTFPAVCPDNLIYNHQFGGCDFDIEGTCKTGW
ncbi:hypothetical protein LSH36_43g07000 [Paralvinella palmiformis]|uniref:Chitin-binding type-2 domain-containing protein n=1 Tax=Paralvinella palmiformis TaxID=53620 RepID=A0AAD9K7U6_9ANNE|nr:hypothetical protein LSH36_43g07000 [Paralvinella palmiformis]